MTDRQQIAAMILAAQIANNGAYVMQARDEQVHDALDYADRLLGETRDDAEDPAPDGSAPCK